MVVERLPVVILPSGRVPGRVLLVLPILEAAAAAEQRWDREKKSCSEGFCRGNSTADVRFSGLDDGTIARVSLKGFIAHKGHREFILVRPLR